jgi:hypothetical protein
MNECMERLEGEISYLEKLRPVAYLSMMLPVLGLVVWMPWGGMVGLALQASLLGSLVLYDEKVRDPKTDAICGYDR